MLEHLRAALRARRNDAFLIIARTDARRSLGFDEALRRARLYADEGADAVFVEYLTDITEVRRLVGAVRVPVVVVVVDGPGALSVGELRSAGVRIALFPLSVLSATVEAAEKTAATLTRPHPARPPVEETENPPNFLRHTLRQGVGVTI
jgi:methylisocitrate lyase